MNKTAYVVGFLFNTTHNTVALVRKTRPPWQAGYFNGIGGHVNPREPPSEAMYREFLEEAGIAILDWQYYCTLTAPGYERGGTAEVYFFTASCEGSNYSLEKKTDEYVAWIDHGRLQHYKVVPNLHWLIPMALAGPEGLRGTHWPYKVTEEAQRHGPCECTPPDAVDPSSILCTYPDCPYGKWEDSHGG